MIRFLSFGLALLLSACATTPRPIAGGPFAVVSQQEAQAGRAAESRVRWGGTIINVTPVPNETCFEVLSRPLDTEGEPLDTDQTEGRFIACRAGFLDPAAYPAGRGITFVGTLRPPAECKIGAHQFRCARLTIESLYLWPKRVVRYPYYFDPFWDPWPYRHPYWR